LGGPRPRFMTGSRPGTKKVRSGDMVQRQRWKGKGGASHNALEKPLSSGEKSSKGEKGPEEEAPSRPSSASFKLRATRDPTKMSLKEAVIHNRLREEVKPEGTIGEKTVSFGKKTSRETGIGGKILPAPYLFGKLQVFPKRENERFVFETGPRGKTANQVSRDPQLRPDKKKKRERVRTEENRKGGKQERNCAPIIHGGKKK